MLGASKSMNNYLMRCYSYPLYISSLELYLGTANASCRPTGITSSLPSETFCFLLSTPSPGPTPSRPLLCPGDLPSRAAQGA